LTRVYTNLFTRKSPYYHLIKYLLFLLKHPVYHNSENTGCPTCYRTLHFFNNSNTNEDIATKFEEEYVRCVRNDEECVCSVCLKCVSVSLQYLYWC